MWSSVGTFGQDLEPQSYAWPFQRVLPGNLPESVIGLDASRLRYQFMVTLERGPLEKNWFEKKDIRVIRAPDPTSPTFTQNAVRLWNENSFWWLLADNLKFLNGGWENMLDYTISTPTTGVIFGTTIRLYFTFFPLVKGYNIGEVVIKVVEKQSHSVSGTWHSWSKEKNRTVFKYTWKTPETKLVDIHGREGYRHRKTLQLPKSLQDCVQSLSVTCLTVTHALEFDLKLRKLSGELSQAVCKYKNFYLYKALTVIQREEEMPITIFISPDLTFENNILVSQPPPGPGFDPIRDIAPPFYGEHSSDQPYREVEGSGFLTPDRGTALGGVSTWIRSKAGGAMSVGRRSGTNTPLSARSRNSSVENLGSTSAVTSLFESLSHNANAVLGSRNRNRNRTRNRGLDVAVSSEEAHEPAAPDTTVGQGSSSVIHYPLISSNSPANITPIVQQTIPENPPPSTEEPIRRTSDHQPTTDYDSVELSKCPSYNTARRRGHLLPVSDGLPSYEAAISTPRASAGRTEPALAGPSAAASPQVLQGRQPEQQEVQVAQAEASSGTLEETNDDDTKRRQAEEIPGGQNAG